ncbi:hypothetical protein GBF38_003024, partial [Nibea albiflora]
MANAHRTNVLVTSCLKTPVDPHTKAPLASYERERALPSANITSHVDNRDYEKEDSGSDFCDEDCLGKSAPLLLTDYRPAGDCLDLSEIFFSNEEYYMKLEELKKAHLRTMAELESMYRQKLQLKSMEPLDMATLETGHRSPRTAERILADIEKEQSSPRMQRWPYVSPRSSRTANSSVCSSLSGSLEHLPAKVTDATKKRHEAVRKQELQRRKEYQQEFKEMQQRVKGRPLLLEQVAQMNAKQAAEKRYTNALHGCDLTEEFISSKVGKSAFTRKASLPSDSKQSDQEESDMGFEPVHYRKVFLDDEDVEVDPEEKEGGSDQASSNHCDGDNTNSHQSDQDDHGGDQHYSD